MLNTQGDIVGILDSSYNIVAQYRYDAWGKIISITDGSGNDVSVNNNHIANINPLRYRGYYYDIETGLYYLNSRYYDPETGRFLNADEIVAGVGNNQGYNLYSYCNNNPVNLCDDSGNWPQWLKNAANAVGNFFKKVGNALINSISFVAGIGYGLGASASVAGAKVSATAYHDALTVGFKNGESYTSSSGSAGVMAGIGKKAKLGVYTAYEHRYETGGKPDWDEHDTSSAPWNIYSCPKTKKDPIQVAIPFVKPIEGDLSNDELFIGISSELHLGVGGHFKLGIDINQFIKVFMEE